MIQYFQEVTTGLLKYKYYHNNTATRILYRLVYSFCKTAVRIILPLYYKMNKSEQPGIVSEAYDNLPPIIMSLTTFPARINSIWLVLETLMRQSLKPNRIILWLATEQFSGGLSELPKKLLALEKRGLEIRFCDDLRSHKKYYYTMQENPDAVVITVDDDVFYPENTVSLLVEQYLKYPDCVVANRVHKITFNGNAVAPYSKWIKFALDTKAPNMLLVPTGVGGCLWPPRILNSEVFNKSAIKELAPLADDMWLKCMGVLNGVKVVKSKPIISEFFSLRGLYKTGLAKQNIGKNLNDVQLGKIIERYNIDFSKYISS